MDRFEWLELRPVSAAPAAGSARPSRQPQDAAGYVQTARALRLAGHFKAAADYYRNALGLNERLYTAWVDRIDCLVRAGLLDAADEASREAHENYRQVRQFYASRALVLGRTGHLARGLELSDISLEQNDHWYPRLIRAELLLLAGPESLPQALSLLEDLLRARQEPWEVCFLGGWMLLDADCPAHASGYFCEAAHCEPTAAASWIGLGDAFQALRLHDQALFYYQRAIELEPHHELALERQRRCVPRRFGLLRMFDRQNLRSRWNRAYERERNKADSELYE